MTELSHEGFLVFTEISGVEDSQICADERTICFGNSPVILHVINQNTFRLPDTGGSGWMKYTAAGILLSGLGAIELYMPKMRRKEEDASS